MSQSTKYTFLVHAIVSVILGIPLLLVPGRFLPLFGWPEDGIDPLISRILGAAVVALAYSSYRGWQAADWDDVKILVEAEAIFTILGVLAMLRHLFGFPWPIDIYSWAFGVWLIFAIFVIFAIAWIVALRRK